MKKLMFSVLALIGLTAVAANAQSNRDTTKHHSMQKENWVKLASTDIPSALQQTLKGPDYAGWTVSAVYRNADSTKYKVELTKDGETKAHFFDQNGNPLHRKKS
jgi:uncharacterized lipoprotein NlpE involved in copper resistance